MWLVTTRGFFSTVAHRARLSGDFRDYPSVMERSLG